MRGMLLGFRLTMSPFTICALVCLVLCFGSGDALDASPEETADLQPVDQGGQALLQPIGREDMGELADEGGRTALGSIGRNKTLTAEKEKLELALHKQKQKLENKKALKNEKLAAKQKQKQKQVDKTMAKMQKKAKPGLSLKEKLWQAQKAYKENSQKVVEILKSTTKSGNKADLKKAHMLERTTKSQQEYARRAQLKIEERKSDTVIIEAGHKARKELVRQQKVYQRALKRTRKYLSTAIQTGLHQDLLSYLKERKQMETTTIAMEKAQQTADAATAVEGKLGDRRLAKNMKDGKDPNPRIAMFVWEARADKLFHSIQKSQQLATKLSKKAKKDGKFAQAKKARKKVKVLKFHYVKALAQVASMKLKTRKGFVMHKLKEEKKMLHKLRNYRQQAKAAQQKMQKSMSLQAKATRKVASDLAKVKSNQKTISALVAERRDTKTHVSHLRKRKRAFRFQCSQAAREVLNAETSLRNFEKLHFQATEEKNSKQHQKITKLSTKVQAAQEELNTLRQQKAQWDQANPKTAIPTAKKPTPPKLSEREMKKEAAKLALKKLKQEQRDETAQLLAKMELLKRGGKATAKAAKRSKQFQSSEETRALEQSRRDEKRKILEARAETKAKYYEKRRKLKSVAKRRLDRRIHRMVLRFNKKISKTKLLVVNAKGKAKRRILLKVSMMEKDRDLRVRQRTATMKRRLRRRLKRADRQRTETAVQLAQKMEEQLKKKESQKILKVTAKKARKALRKIKKVKRRIIKQQLGVLQGQRRDIVDMTRNKVGQLLLRKRSTTDPVSLKHIDDSIRLAQKQADVKILHLTEKYKSIADAKIAKAAVKVLRVAKGAASRRKLQLDRYLKRRKKMEAKAAERQAKRKFEKKEKQGDKFKAETAAAMSKVAEEVSKMEKRVRLRSLKRITDFEKRMNARENTAVKKAIQAQNMMSNAAATPPKNMTTKFQPSNNPYEGKGNLSKRAGRAMKKNQKKIRKFKAKEKIRMEHELTSRKRKIKFRLVQRLERQKGQTRERIYKSTTAKKRTDRKVRRTKRRLNRALRKASKTGKKVDKLKVARARAAAESSKVKAQQKMAAARVRRKQRKMAAERSKTYRIQRAAERAVRRATASLREASIQGSRAALHIANRHLEIARHKLSKANERALDVLKRKGLEEYQEALVKGGSPTGGGPVSTPTSQALAHFTYLVKRAKETHKASDYLVAKTWLHKTKRELRRAKRAKLEKQIRQTHKAQVKCKHHLKFVLKDMKDAHHDVQKIEKSLHQKKHQLYRNKARQVIDKKAAAMSKVLAEIGKDTNAMKHHQVERLQTYLRALRDRARQGAKRINAAQTAAVDALARVQALSRGKTILKRSTRKKIANQKLKMLKTKAKEKHKNASLESKTKSKLRRYDQKKEKREQRLDKVRMSLKALNNTDSAVNSTKTNAAKKLLLSKKKALKGKISDIKSKEVQVEKKQDLKMANLTACAKARIQSLKGRIKAEKGPGKIMTSAETSVEKSVLRKENSKIQAEVAKAKRKYARKISKEKSAMDVRRKLALKKEKKTTQEFAQFQRRTQAALKKLKLKSAGVSEKKQAALKQEESKQRQRLRQEQRKTDAVVRKVKKKLRKHARKHARLLEKYKLSLRKVVRKGEKDAAKARKSAVKAAKQAKKQAKRNVIQQNNATKKTSPVSLKKRISNAEKVLAKVAASHVAIEKALHTHIKQKLEAIKKAQRAGKSVKKARKLKRKLKKHKKKIKHKLEKRAEKKVGKKLKKTRKKRRQKAGIRRKIEKPDTKDDREFQKLAVGYTTPLKSPSNLLFDSTHL